MLCLASVVLKHQQCHRAAFIKPISLNQSRNRRPSSTCRPQIIAINADAGKAKKRVIRAKVDTRHLNLVGTNEIHGKPVVCMPKHLCGVATDLSLYIHIGGCWWLSLFHHRLNDNSIGLR
jgi:hypothetical protein